MSEVIDLTNQRFGKLAVLGRGENTRKGEAQWRCKCDCGNIVLTRGSSLRSGYKTDCGGHRRAWNLENLKGKRFGRLVVLNRTDNTKDGQAQWMCLCDCGHITVVRAAGLKSGKTKSCGCYKAEIVKTCSITHGMSKTRLWRIWNDMHVRCEYSSATQYRYYGGKGVRVCEEWTSFEPFRDWAFSNGYSDSLTIDRVDVNGDYAPSNCRWATWREQQNNKTSNHFLTMDRRTQTLSQWAEEIGVDRQAIERCLSKGWSDEKTLSSLLKKVTVSA